MEKFKTWLLWSSVNKEKISLTVKAGVPLLLTILTNLGLSFTHVDVQDLTGLIGDFVFNVIQVASLVVTLYGIIRKVILTSKTK